MKCLFHKTASLLLALLLLLGSVPSAFANEGNSDASGTAGQASAAAVQPEDSGIIDAAALDAWMDDYVAQHGLDADFRYFSVGFCYTGTGDCWFYHADDWMYSASLYKVPVSMLAAEKEAAGEITQDTEIANQYGGGTLQRLEMTALINSNNDSGHALVEYLGGTYSGKCADQTVRFTPLGDGYFTDDDFYNYSYYTARYMTYVMKTLFDGGEEAFPHVLEYLQQAQPMDYFKSDESLRNRYVIAQKYGAYQEQNGNDNNHCAAIIYTPTPIIVTVMTRNVGNYQNRIAEVGAYLADVALQLDEKKAALDQAAEEAAAAAATEEQGADPSAVEGQPGEVPSGSSPDSAPGETPDTGPSAELSQSAAVPIPADEENGRKMPAWLIPLIAVILAAAAVLAVVRRALGGRKKRRVKKQVAERTAPQKTQEPQPRQVHKPDGEEPRTYRPKH